MSRQILVFATSKYEYLKKAMLAAKAPAGYTLTDGQIARSQDKDGTPRLPDVPFPDGERYHRIISDVEDREVLLIGGTIDDAETLELIDLGYGLVDRGALRLRLLVPYFGYSTMERAVFDGELAKAKIRAHLISSIPRAQNGNTIYLLDLHSEGIPYYFDPDRIRSRHIYAKDLVIDAVEKVVREWQESKKVVLAPVCPKAADAGIKLQVRVLTCHAPNVDAAFDEASAQPFDFTLASTDAGRAKWVESLVRDMVKRGIPAHPAFIIKRRTSGTDTEVADISADVAGKLVVIYDDMCRTGGSAIKAAQAYLAKGAIGVILVITHVVMPGGSLDKLKDSGVFFRVVGSDSHPRANELAGEFLHVESTAQMFVDKIFHSCPE
jgi:Phosphoribosylpyrophosphate synthetase